MARPWKELRGNVTPEQDEEIRAGVERDLLEMNLRELRQGHVDLTQTDVAELLGVTQGAISQMEKRQDALLSKLADYVKVLGGRLELVARFPDRKPVRITQFEAVREQITEERVIEG